MKFEVTRHKNGYIIKAEDEEQGIVYEEQEGEECEHEAFARFLRVLMDHYGPVESRYSEKRIYVRVEPGDKWEPAKNEKYEDYYCEKCGKYIKED